MIRSASADRLLGRLRERLREEEVQGTSAGEREDRVRARPSDGSVREPAEEEREDDRELSGWSTAQATPKKLCL